jgi:ferrous iron transport protein B
VLIATVWALIAASTAASQPLQAGLNNLISGPVSSAAVRGLRAVGLDGSWVSSFLVGGLLTGVGQLLTFVPLYAFVAASLIALERSGFLARSSAAAHSLMRRLGLPGESMLILVLGFGCNVPSIGAAGHLGSVRHRRVTAILAPLVTCTARLPVYVLVAQAALPGRSAAVVAAMYAMSIGIVLSVAVILRVVMGSPAAVPGDGAFPAAPPLCRPLVLPLLAETLRRLVAFIRGVAVVVTAAVAVAWLLAAIPLGGAPAGSGFGHVPLGHSVLGRTAGAVAPVFGPAGFGDPAVTAALATGVVAKEAMVASFAQTLSSGPVAATSTAAALRQRLADSSGGHPGGAGLALCAFVLAYAPCIPSFAAQRTVMGARWAVSSVAVQTAAAWALAVVVFQLARLVV